MSEARESVSKAVSDRRGEATCRVWQTLLIQESMLRDKSRVRWIREGDSNSKFFHSVMKRNFQRNGIVELNSNMGLLNKVGDIKLKNFNHFSHRFSDSELHRLTLQGVSFNSLTKSNIGMLEEPLSMEEMKEVIWNLGSEKSPGPNGSNMVFF